MNIKKNGFIIHDLKDIKPIRFDNLKDYYSEDYYKFRNINYRPYKKGEFYVRYDSKNLNENLINYPKPVKTEIVIKSLLCTGLLPYNFIVPDPDTDASGINGYIIIAVPITFLRKGNMEGVVNAMRKLGYFQSKQNPDGYIHPKLGNVLFYQFEPYYFGKRKLTINDQLLHVSTIDNKDSILRNGFIASCKNKEF